METQASLCAGPSAGRVDVLDAEVIDAIVDRLRRMRRTATLALAIDVGSLIVESVFHGDSALVRSQGRKHGAFRQLAAHPRIPFAKSTLWRYVRVYELVRRMPGLVKQHEVTVAHLTAVLSLSPERQERLLKLAVRHSWTAARLAKEAEASAGTGLGAPKRAGIMVAVRRLERIHATLPELGRATDLRPAARERIRTVLEGTRAWCEAVDCWLRAGAAKN